MDIYLTYCRKSSEQEDRQVHSVEDQTSELGDISERMGLEVLEVLPESKSAKVENSRPNFSKMLGLIEEKQANSILVWHPDRLSRNPIDAAKIISLMDSSKLKQVRTPTQLFTSNPMDKFMLGFLMLQAKLENDNKGVNVKRGLKSKAEKGHLPSGAKPGYMNDKYEEKGNKKLFPDPVRHALIKKAWETFLTGSYSVPQILKMLNDEWGYRAPKRKSLGGNPMQRSQLYEVFNDTYYYGEFEYPEESGNWYKTAHEPMITKEEFDRGQALLGSKSRPRPKSKTFDYSGLMSCGECGAAITAEEKWQIICSMCKVKFHKGVKTDKCNSCGISIEDMNNPKTLHYIFYHCTKRKNPKCSQGGVEVKKLESQIDEALSKIQISERFKGWAIKYLNELNDKESYDRNAILRSLQEAYSDCIKRMDNLVKLKISPQNTDGSLLSDEEFINQKNALTAEKKMIEEKMKKLGERIDDCLELSEENFEFACYARYWFANGDREKKREILLGLGSNLTILNKTLVPNLKKPLTFIEEAIKNEPSISEMLEPEEKIDKSSKLEALWTQNPVMLPRVDSNHEP